MFDFGYYEFSAKIVYFDNEKVDPKASPKVYSTTYFAQFYDDFSNDLSSF